MKKVIKETSILDTLLESASINETNKRTLNESELIVLVDKHYNDVTSKNAMLKLIRSLNYSVSMSRCFKVYIDYTKLLSKDKDTKKVS